MDHYLFKAINSFAGSYLWLDTLAIFFAAFFQYVLAMGLVFFMLARRNMAALFRNLKTTVLAFGGAIVSRFIFGEIIKRAVARPRPFSAHQVNQLISYSAVDVSFPSGHTAFFFALSTVVYLYFKKNHPNKIILPGAIMYAGSFLIGLARIFVGLHYPLDIFGGAVSGVLVGWASYRIFSKKI